MMDGSPTIVEVPYAAVAHWRSAAAKARTSVADSRGTRWFKAGDSGCAGLITVGGGVRIKGVYVVPEGRGKGLGTAFVDFLTEQARSAGAAFIEAYAWNEAFYAGRGFQLIGRNCHGAARLRKDLKK